MAVESIAGNTLTLETALTAAVQYESARNLSTQRSPFFLLPRFVSSFQNKVCQVCLRTQRGCPSCPQHRRGQDGHRKPGPVTPVTPQTISSELEGGRGRGRGWRKTGRTFSSFNIPNVLAFFSRSAPCWVPFPVSRLHTERRRRDTPPTSHVPRRPRGPRQRSHRPHCPRRLIGPFPRCSPHRGTYIKFVFCMGRPENLWKF
jgi:hypothetical protein